MWRIVIVLVLMGLCVHTASALDGSGTQEDPWRIQSLADFDEFAADPNYWSGFTRLQIDVNLAGRTYTTAVIAPDVDNSNPYFNGTAFTGIFDGNDHKIIGLTINGGTNDYLGLFGYIVDGEVKNLRLEDGYIRGGGLVGGLLGANRGSISNCYSTGFVWGNNYVGGLVGRNYSGTITNCYFTGSVIGYVEYVGGLVGINNGSVSNCYSTGSVSGDWAVGGLLGGNYGSVSNCYSTGFVTGTGSRVGVLVGENVGSISNCHSTGDVVGGWVVGGLVGENGWSIECYSSAGHIFNSYSTGDVNGVDYVGGLVGYNLSGDISNCYSTSDVNGTGWAVGGLVGGNGYFHMPWPTCIIVGYIFNSYSTGSVQGDPNVGGLVGYHAAGDFDGAFWDVQTSGEPNMCGGQGWGTGCDPNCGKTTAEMKTKSTFTDADWDFIEIWGIGEHQTYPYLRFAPAGDINGDSIVNLKDFALMAFHWLEEQ